LCIDYYYYIDLCDLSYDNVALFALIGLKCIVNNIRLGVCTASSVPAQHWTVIDWRITTKVNLVKDLQSLKVDRREWSILTYWFCACEGSIDLIFAQMNIILIWYLPKKISLRTEAVIVSLPTSKYPKRHVSAKKLS
jgi:hypothetical protein